MAETKELVEHYFRHEYGRLVALLTRSFGVHRLSLAEDVVQSALSKALQSWGRSGIPDNPTAWLYRTARNLALDSLRREQTENNILAEQSDQFAEAVEDRLTPSTVDEDLQDETLRLLFLCCHPQVPLEASIAFALKTVSGFSIDEIASAFLISKANAEKRITRAKERLREIGEEIADLSQAKMLARLDAVNSAIYLLFNEGFASTSGDTFLRRDICEEAIRLGRMLLSHDELATPSSNALVALMLFLSARFDARYDANGSLVLLEDQDRTRWDWSRVQEALAHMQRSAQGDQLSRYHVEAAIAWEHLRAASFAEIEWQKVVNLYQILHQLHPTPMIRLSLAISLGYAEGPETGVKRLGELSTEDRSKLRPWWDCAIAECYQRLNMKSEALAHLHDALALATNREQREQIHSKIARNQGVS